MTTDQTHYFSLANHSYDIAMILPMSFQAFRPPKLLVTYSMIQVKKNLSELVIHLNTAELTDSLHHTRLVNQV